MNEVDQRWAVGSLDVKSLYPSLDIPTCAKVVGDRLYKAQLEFIGLDWREIAPYIR